QRPGGGLDALARRLAERAVIAQHAAGHADRDARSLGHVLQGHATTVTQSLTGVLVHGLARGLARALAYRLVCGLACRLRTAHARAPPLSRISRRRPLHRFCLSREHNAIDNL